MQMSDLWAAWPVTGPWQLAPLKGGTNNRMLRAETADGQEYVLRIVPDLTRISHIRYGVCGAAEQKSGLRPILARDSLREAVMNVKRA